MGKLAALIFVLMSTCPAIGQDSGADGVGQESDNSSQTIQPKIRDEDPGVFLSSTLIPPYKLLTSDCFKREICLAIVFIDQGNRSEEKLIELARYFDQKNSGKKSLVVLFYDNLEVAVAHAEGKVRPTSLDLTAMAVYGKDATEEYLRIRVSKGALSKTASSNILYDQSADTHKLPADPIVKNTPEPNDYVVVAEDCFSEDSCLAFVSVTERLQSNSGLIALSESLSSRNLKKKNLVIYFFDNFNTAKSFANGNVPPTDLEFYAIGAYRYDDEEEYLKSRIADQTEPGKSGRRSSWRMIFKKPVNSSEGNR